MALIPANVAGLKYLHRKMTKAASVAWLFAALGRHPVLPAVE
jgi:hypothetical protein